MNTNYKALGEEVGIKVEGTPIEYGDSKAVRCDKTGKGRYDLIPKEMVRGLMKIFANDRGIEEYSFSHNYILNAAFNGHYDEAIFGMIGMADADDIGMIESCEVTRHMQRKNFIFMMKELALHFEKGAKVYGENNWKGLPKKSFIDSGLRHLLQWMNGEDDENHYISAIWNFTCAMYVIGKED